MNYRVGLLNTGGGAEAVQPPADALKKQGFTIVERGDARGAGDTAQAVTGALDAAGFSLVERGDARGEADIEAWFRARLSACDVILTLGGIGPAPTDVTPEATRRVIERDLPGIPERLRFAGFADPVTATLSRGAAGIARQTLIVNLPGDAIDALRCLQLLLPLLAGALSQLHGVQGRETGSTQSEDPPRATDLPEQAGAHAETRDSEGADLPPEIVVSLESNLDDSSPEIHETLMRRLFEAGALDVFFTPIQMKKSRQAVLVTALAPVPKEDAVRRVMFEESSTFGVRSVLYKRQVLRRLWRAVTTPYGVIRVKVGSLDGVEMSASPEYEEVKIAAAAAGVPVKRVFASAAAAYEQLRGTEAAVEVQEGGSVE